MSDCEECKRLETRANLCTNPKLARQAWLELVLHKARHHIWHPAIPSNKIPNAQRPGVKE